MPFETIQSKRLFEHVADQVSGLISSGEFEPGNRLPPERDLAKQLGVSRPTVREAMIALEMSGFVEVRVGAGIFVSPPQPQSTLNYGPQLSGPSPTELLEARFELEPTNAALAAERIRPEQLEDLEEAITLQIEEDAIGAEGDYRFHQLIAEATGNRALVAMTEYLWGQMQHSPMWQRLIEQAQLTGLYPVILDDHRGLLDAFRRRDSNSSRDIMKHHLQHAQEIFFSLVNYKSKT